MLRRRRARLMAAALPALFLLVAAGPGTVRAASNRPPVAADDRVTIDRGQPFSVNVLRNDSDADGDRLHIVKVTARNDRSRLEWAADGTVSGKPIINEGFALFTYTVADDQGATADGNLTVALAEVDTPGNDRPIARTERVRAYEGRPVTVSVLDNDSDVDGDPLSVSVFDCCHGTDAVVNPDQTITLTPHSITSPGIGYRVSDGRLTADTYVTVEQMPLNGPGNDPPRPGPDLVFAHPGETKLVPLLDNDQDIDGDPLRLTGVAIGAAGSSTVEPDGRTARIAVHPTARGMYEMSYTTSDGRGGTAGGYYSYLFVFDADNPGPETPVANADRAATTEGTAVTVSPLANDVDHDGDDLRLRGVNPVGPPGFGTATANSDGTVTFTPAPGKTGQAVVPYTVSDGTAALSTSEIRIDVVPRSASAAGPVLGRDQASVAAFGTVTIPVLDNDYDPAGGRLRITKLYDGVNGTASLSADGRSVIYRHKDVLPAFDTLVYYVTDSAGRTAYQSVDISVMLRDTAADQAPMAYGDYPETERGRPMTVRVLANDADLEGGTLRVTRLTKPVQHGTAVITPDGQAIRYTPDPDFEGTEYVEYQMTDGTTTSRADLWLRVIGSMTGGDLAEDDLGITLQGRPVTIPVLENDRNPVASPSFGHLVTAPAHGRAEPAAGGTLRYTPNPSWYGIDSFRYMTADGAAATVSVHVVAVRGGTVPSPPVDPDPGTGSGGTGGGDPGSGGGPGTGSDGGVDTGSDGGSAGGGSGPGDVAAGGSRPTTVPGTPGGSGYWMLDAAGQVYPFGEAASFGAPTLGPVAAVDLERTPAGHGYWVLDRSGRVHAFGDAAPIGDVDVRTLAPGETASSLSATPTGRGYWVFTNRGRAVAFGDAAPLGDMSATALNGPVLDSVATPSGRGYYMVASDGGIFAFGDARFAGSMGGQRLNAPVQSLVPDADGAGYWLVASDGGIFAFNAPFHGSMGGTRLARPVTGMVGSRTGHGYLMVAEDGGIFAFGDVPFRGSLGASPPPVPIVAAAAY